MKHRIGIFVFVAIGIGAFFIGMSGKFTLAKPVNQDDSTQSLDRLIGAIIRTEPLELLSQDDRIYATGDDFNFGGIEGIRWFAYVDSDQEDNFVITPRMDSEILDPDMHISFADDEIKLSLEGTIYVSTISAPERFIMYRVYQNIEGDIYVTSKKSNSIGLGINAEEGQLFSMQFDETHTQSLNGKTTTESAYFQLTFSYCHPPEHITVVQMDAQYRTLGQETYLPGLLPETLVTQEKTTYILVETLKKDGIGDDIKTHDIYDVHDSQIETIYSIKDGIILRQKSDITW